MTDPTPHDGFTPTDPDRLDGPRAAERAPYEPTGARRHGSAASVADSDDAGRHDTGALEAGSRGASVPAAAHANAHTGSRPQVDGHADRPNYGVGPFSVREVALLGIWVVAFIVSFFRTNILDSPSGVLLGGANVWLSGLWWIPAIALPTVAVGLLVLRRLSPQGIRRVGSLGIDQFASVAFTVSALVWVSWVWDTVAVFDATAIWTRSWVIWVEAVLLLAGVVLTVFGPFIPPFSADFRGREEVPAHRNARPIRPVVARPRTPRTTKAPVSAAPAHPGADADADAPVPGSYTGSTDLAHDPAPATSVLPAHADDNDTDVFAPLRDDHDERGEADARDDHSRWAAPADAEPAAERRTGYDEHARDEHKRDEHPHAQAFWALAPEEREIVDDYGTPIFRIGPTAWALVIEDRGETFVVRHDDGRIGYLHDVSGVTRG
ncbi:hypothetical protein [Microbacterium testaceum]|uniref:hypothetical protein n=1 Tax=Microbacterium testaceum TaxID=2033 RepID=UPI001CDA14C2|nr:hypothetical protein [Microbacterium testaceum]